MPTYEYRCPKGHAFEVVQRITGPARAKCPRCGMAAERQMSGGAGLIFKGSGFYITDYGKDGKGPRKDPSEKSDSGGSKESKPAAEAKAAPSAKSDAKPAAKSESKSGKHPPNKSGKAAPE